METIIRRDDTLHVAVFEIEPGLYHATYRTDGAVPAIRIFPPYHVGSGVCDAKARIERYARSHGFQTIVWDGSTFQLD
jgi:hypothetical protein